MIPIWLGITIVAAIIEILTTDLVSIWFAAGGIVSLIACLLGASQTIQIVLFAIVSIFTIIIVRPIAKKYLRTNIEKTNVDRVIGKHGLVTKTITADNKGEVKVMSTSWPATSLDNSVISEGNYCEIVAIEGVHLVVKKIEE
ncbi:MAG TPA: NfeD family protein [Candidatus Erysipelatoclostridium merdavium]|uniref:NfeD family protein n=1 Tax=Candidatus Erysipelatoclostridium merdavium TaxID=2838566 RepID=A0A9D1XNX7_9FIRM|nr:NfeD family protein [Candidatus Erysipelatoclostridium merdavium]